MAKDAKKKRVLVDADTSFTLEDLTDRWRIHGVHYRGRICCVDVSKTLLDEGDETRQAKWIAYSQQAQQRGDLYVPNSQLCHSVCAAAYDNKDSPAYRTLIEGIRKAWQCDFQKGWMATLSLVNYKSRSADQVVHDIGLPSQYTIKAGIVGMDQYILEDVAEGQNAAALNALLGDNDPQRINAIYKWITGEKTIFWRLNSKPKKDHACLVLLGLDFYDNFSLMAAGRVNDRFQARGISVQKISGGNGD